MKDELISRQEALKALKDIEFKLYFDKEYKLIRAARAQEVIKNLPTVQPTQEIIRCKDCRFWKKYKYFNGKPTYAPFCGFNSIFTDDNDFCSRAKRRGEAE